MQPNPEPQFPGRPPRSAQILDLVAHGIELLGDLSGRLTPRQVHVGVFGGHLQRLGRGAAQVDVGPRLGGDDGRVLHRQVLAGERDRLAGPQLPEDREELGGPLVALGFAEVVTEAALLDVVAAGDNVEQQPIPRDALVRRGRLGNQGRGLQPRPESHEVLEVFGPLGQGRREHPGVLAPTAGRGQRPGEPELLRGAGHQTEVVEVGRPVRTESVCPAACATDGVAETQVGARVTIGRQEPVQRDRHRSTARTRRDCRCEWSWSEQAWLNSRDLMPPQEIAVANAGFSAKCRGKRCRRIPPSNRLPRPQRA